MNKHKGVILISVTIALSLIAIIAYLLQRESGMQINQVSYDIATFKAQPAAEAGLSHAHWLAARQGCDDNINIPLTTLGDYQYKASMATNAEVNHFTFSADRDTWINETSEQTNYGSATEILVKNQEDDRYAALLHFNVSSIPTDAFVTSAILKLNILAGDPNGTLKLHILEKNWTEEDATWETLDNQYATATTGYIPHQTTTNNEVTVNLTHVVQSWIKDTATNNGLIIMATSDDYQTSIASREHSQPAKHPQLIVNVASSSVSPVTMTSTGLSKLDSSQTIIKKNVPMYQQMTSFVIKPGSGLKDTYTWADGHDNRNFGRSSILKVDLPTDHQTTLIQFDLSPIPKHARVQEAKLNLYLVGGNNVTNGVISAHKITREWIEGNYDDEVPYIGGATHESYSGFDFEWWSNEGGDYEQEPIDRVTLTTLTPAWVQWEVTEQVNQWLAGEDNYGFLLTATGGDVNKVTFTSSDSENAAHHPYLSLTLACECDYSCANFYSHGNILMVVGNPLSLDSQTQDLISLFTSWGYHINLIDDDTFDFDIAAQAQNNDIAYITESVYEPSLGQKMTNLPIGIINEENHLNDDLGIATGFSTAVGDAINIINSSHPITQHFTLNKLKIYDKNMQGWAIGGTLASGATVLANWNNTESLVVIDKDEALLSGYGNAAGRRILSPIGGDIVINHAYINQNGHLLLHRMIEWGMGRI